MIITRINLEIELFTALNSFASAVNRLHANDTNMRQLRKIDNRGGRKNASKNASSRPFRPTALWSQGCHRSLLQTILYCCKYILGL